MSLLSGTLENHPADSFACERKEKRARERLRRNTVFAVHPALAPLHLPCLRDACASVSVLPTCDLLVSAKSHRANVLEAAPGQWGSALEVEGETEGTRRGPIAAFKWLEIESSRGTN